MDFKTLGTVPLQDNQPIMPSGGMMPPELSSTPMQPGQMANDQTMPDPGPGLDQMPSAKPGVPGDGSGIATPEQIAELHDLLAAIEQKHQENGTDKIINQNEMDASTKELLSGIFSILRDAGVDLNSQDSINEFMTSLEQSNPDMYDIFAELLNELMDPGLPDGQTKGLDLSSVPTDEAAALAASQSEGQPPLDLSQVPQQ